jgi:type I restriction enzyme R subunit
MKGHTLMQAIARANRVAEGKPNGLIVDYNGLLKSLRRALATYAGGRSDPGPGLDPVRPQVELLHEYIADLQACLDYLASLGYEPQDLIDAEGFDKNQEIKTAAETVALNDVTRARFEILANEVFKKARTLIGHPWLSRYKRQHDAIEAIYKRLQKTEDDPADIIEILLELQGVVDNAVRLTGEPLPATESGRSYDMSRINFERLRQEFQRAPDRNLTLQTLKQKVEAKLNRMVQQNPTRLDLQTHYQQIIEAYNRETDRAMIEKTFEQLVDFIETLSEEETRAVREGRREEYLTAFDLLCKHKNNLRPATRERIKRIAVDLLEAVKAQIAAMDNWTAKTTTQAAIRTLIYDYLYAEETGLPLDDYSDEEVKSLAADFFAYVQQQYPTSTPFIFAPTTVTIDN